MTDKDEGVLHGEIVPPRSDATRLTMPNGTPLGLGILGRMRFNAIRRVLEGYEQALRAKAAGIDAGVAVGAAIIRREQMEVQLGELPTIREDERRRIMLASKRLKVAEEEFDAFAEIARVRRKLELLEAKEQLAEAEARGKLKKAGGRNGNDGVKSDEFESFMSDLGKMPDIVKAVEAAKEQIIKDAGGADKLTEAQQQVCELFDAMLQSFISKKAGDAAL